MGGSFGESWTPKLRNSAEGCMETHRPYWLNYNNKLFAPDDDQRLLQLRAEDLSFYQIDAKLDRSAGSSELRWQAIRPVAPEELQQQRMQHFDLPLADLELIAGKLRD